MAEELFLALISAGTFFMDLSPTSVVVEIRATSSQFHPILMFDIQKDLRSLGCGQAVLIKRQQNNKIAQVFT